MQNISIYQLLIDVIHAKGHSIARNWIEPAYHRQELFEDAETTDTRLEDVLISLEQSKAVIADVSGRGTFGIGYLVAIAEQKEIPILLLHEQGSEKGLLPSAIRRDHISYVEFEKGVDLGMVVNKFLDAWRA